MEERYRKVMVPCGERVVQNGDLAVTWGGGERGRGRGCIER